MNRRTIYHHCAHSGIICQSWFLNVTVCHAIYAKWTWTSGGRESECRPWWSFYGWECWIWVLSRNIATQQKRLLVITFMAMEASIAKTTATMVTQQTSLIWRSVFRVSLQQTWWLGKKALNDDKNHYHAVTATILEWCSLHTSILFIVHMETNWWSCCPKRIRNENDGEATDALDGDENLDSGSSNNGHGPVEMIRTSWMFFVDLETSGLPSCPRRKQKLWQWRSNKAFNMAMVKILTSAAAATTTIIASSSSRPWDGIPKSFMVHNFSNSTS